LTEHRPHQTRLRRRRNPPGHHTREHPRPALEQRRPGGHARRQTASSHDETRSCGTQPAHISLTARRGPARTAASSAEPTPPVSEDPTAHG
jgi:hypothetical protein